MSVENRSLKDTVVAITGASAGIGREAARQLVAAGAKVAIGARRTERLEELAEELGQENVLTFELDVTSPEQNNVFIAETIKRFGKIDSLVANAGIGHYGGICDISDDELTNMMNVNFAGTVWSVRAAVPEFRKAGGGDIIIVSSVAGFRGGANEAVYAATKHAQIGLAGSIDRELTPEGIRVTAICPAGTHTEFAMGTGRTEETIKEKDYMQPEDVAFQIITALQQPRRLRTGIWTTWSMSQSG